MKRSIAIAGNMGTGKSTLVERWLSELPRDETAVIVNEAGEVGIDGALLEARASRSFGEARSRSAHGAASA